MNTGGAAERELPSLAEAMTQMRAEAEEEDRLYAAANGGRRRPCGVPVLDQLMDEMYERERAGVVAETDEEAMARLERREAELVIELSELPARRARERVIAAERQAIAVLCARLTKNLQQSAAKRVRLAATRARGAPTPERVRRAGLRKNPPRVDRGPMVNHGVDLRPRRG